MKEKKDKRLVMLTKDEYAMVRLMLNSMYEDFPWEDFDKRSKDYKIMKGLCEKFNTTYPLECFERSKYDYGLR